MNLFLDTSICIDVLRANGPDRSFEIFERLGEEIIGYISAGCHPNLFSLQGYGKSDD